MVLVILQKSYQQILIKSYNIAISIYNTITVSFVVERVCLCYDSKSSAFWAV